MSSDNPLSDATEGTVNSLLEWSAEKISLLVKKFKERKLAFIQDPKTIEIVKEQYRSGEGKFYESYVENKEFLFLMRLGLTLRKLEKDEDRLHNLRDKIFRKYKVSGLHIAELVQTGAMNRYVGILIDELTSIEDLKKEIEEILAGIEKYVIFVQGTDKPSKIIKEAFSKVSSHSPSIFIVSGIGPAAKIVQKCTEKFKSIFKNYELEKFSGGEKEILFFKRRI